MDLKSRNLRDILPILIFLSENLKNNTMKPKILFTIFLVLGMNLSLNAQTLYVDVNNNTGIEDGTEAHPFNTIKEGISAAVPGTLVMIRQGTYIPDEFWSGNDHTLLLKAGVTLKGETHDNTIISGIVVDQQSGNLPVGLENLKFEEFHFIRGTASGPFNDKNIVRNCAATLVSLGFAAGIPVNDTTPGPNHGFLIENNDLGNEGIIEFNQGNGVSELLVAGNTCGYVYLKSGGGYTYLVGNNDVRYGIFDQSARNRTTISGNRIFNGTITDNSGGNAYGIEDEIIENNTIAANENSPAFAGEVNKAGIIAKCRSVTIRNNTVTCTGKVSGIRSSAGAPLNIINNTITLDEVQTPDPEPEEGTIGIFNYSGRGLVTGNKIYGGGHGYFSKAGTTEFSGNEIVKSYTGFYSMGAEVVHHNIVKNCSGDGMILDGLKGPLHHNEILNNSGAGIRILYVPIDLGGGADNSPGMNTIRNNGNFDLYIETVSTQHPTVYARFNIWDHVNADLIAQQDIRDGSDSTGLVNVDFTPFGGQGTNDQPGYSGPGAYPNPCFASSVIEWRTTYPGKISLRVFDCMGKEVKTLVDEIMAPGNHKAVFNATGIPAGVYFYQLGVNGVVQTKKLIISPQ